MDVTGSFSNPDQLKVNELVKISDNIKPPASSSLIGLRGKLGLILGFKGSLCYILFEDGIHQLYPYLVERVKQ
tara:strand:- start:261 stop:479 length:219 start_codon:yes stop_codon:yes gene_type:complete